MLHQLLPWSPLLTLEFLNQLCTFFFSLTSHILATLSQPHSSAFTVRAGFDTRPRHIGSRRPLVVTDRNFDQDIRHAQLISSYVKCFRLSEPPPPPAPLPFVFPALSSLLHGAQEFGSRSPRSFFSRNFLWRGGSFFNHPINTPQVAFEPPGLGSQVRTLCG